MQKNLKFSIDLDAFLSHDLMYLMKNFAIKYQENDFKAKVGKLIIKQKGLNYPVADDNNHVDLSHHFVPRPNFNKIDIEGNIYTLVKFMKNNRYGVFPIELKYQA